MTQKRAQKSAGRATETISQDLTLWCVDPWSRAVQVPTTLGYRADDPYAVSLTFHSGAGDVEWVASRMLLVQGLGDDAGDGDIKVSPSVDDDGTSILVLDFSSPDGELVAHADAFEVQSFLTRSFALVPVGTESDRLDIDTLIAQLLETVED